MAPRFAFRPSKFRNVECTCLPREQSFDQLQVATSPVDGNVLAASASTFAFAHQMDNGGAVQVKHRTQTGKEAPKTPPLVRAHPTGRVTALSFSPFHDDLLLSAGDANATVKLWRLSTSEPMTEDLVTPLTEFQHMGIVVGIAPHPSTASIVATYSRPGPLRIYDLEAENLSFEVDVDAVVSAAAWNWDGSAMVMTTLNQAVRLLDPRVDQLSTPAVEAAHTGKRHLSVMWCGRTQHFVTCGSDRMQERELKLWDPRQLSKCIHRERLDAGGVGQLFPMYDVDLDLLYLLGKGDRSARLFEVDLARAPYVHALDHSALGSMTLAATLLPKMACDTNVCEIARVLNLSVSGTSVGGSCEVVSYRVPRKETIHSFQSDLYPDTLAPEAALTSEEWRQGRNAEPKLQVVSPTIKTVVFERPTASALASSGWGTRTSSATTSGWQSSGWGQALSSTASSKAPSKTASDVKTGWGSSSRRWNVPEPKAQTATSPAAHWNSSTVSTTTASITTGEFEASTAPPLAPSSTQVPLTENPEMTHVSAPVSPPTTSNVPSAGTGPSRKTDVVELSDKAQRLGAKYGHKLKYLQGKEAPRNDVFHFGDKRVAFSIQASPVITANATFWAAPIAGAGGPVLVETLNATGKAQHGAASVINGQKAEVSALAFNPFDDHVLATGSGDATIQLWSLGTQKNAPGKLAHTLLGHTKGIRTLQFNPTASDVLCSSSQDLSLRLWDIEAGHEKLCLQGKLDDITWNMAFNDDGTLLATASRAKIVRVFDPRQPEHALVAIGCGHESSKPQFVTWADSTRLLTVGVNARNETQVSFWDSRNLLEPIAVPVLVEPTASAASITTPIPLYDASSHLLFLVGTGSRHIWSYEVDPIGATVKANLPFMMAGTDTIGGVALLPKTICDVRDVELARLLVATPNMVERVSFSLPRAQKLKEFFQDDVFGLIPKHEPSVTGAEWFTGKSRAPVYESLRPDGMLPLSEKPTDVISARPKTLDFQARRREEEEKERQHAAQFARLSTLAAQPSLHSARHTEVNPSAPQPVEVDSDDDWDD